MLGLGQPPLGFGPLPALIGIIFASQMFIVYLMAVLEGDVDAVLPYISSAANRRPQSCIFAIGANISCLLMAAMIYVRHYQVNHALIDEENRFYRYLTYWGGQIISWNAIAKYIGLLSVLGLFVVANVQETAVIPVHMAAALTAFGGFNIYMMFQCWFTWAFTGTITHRNVFIWRVFFTVLSTIFFISSVTFGTLAANIYHQTYPDLPTPRPWNRRFYQPGYGYHQISAAAEWLCAFSQILFMQSFIPEFEEVNYTYELSMPPHLYPDPEEREEPPYITEEQRNELRNDMPRLLGRLRGTTE